MVPHFINIQNINWELILVREQNNGLYNYTQQFFRGKHNCRDMRDFTVGHTLISEKDSNVTPIVVALLVSDESHSSMQTMYLRHSVPFLWSNRVFNFDALSTTAISISAKWHKKEFIELLSTQTLVTGKLSSRSHDQFYSNPITQLTLIYNVRTSIRSKCVVQWYNDHRVSVTCHLCYYILQRKFIIIYHDLKLVTFDQTSEWLIGTYLNSVLWVNSDSSRIDWF